MAESDDRLPRRCGRYVLFERFGGGGMAEVYKARIAQSAGPERILVIKLLPRHCGPHEAARFIEEAKIALPLTHGNVTATFEFARHEGRPFLVMEYVHGRSLRQILSRSGELGRKVGVGEAVFVCREVARALRYAHNFVGVGGQRAPIVHRDVSPENVLVSYSGQVKLTDFGIARSLEALDVGGVWGKPAYVAPEIVAGSPGGPPSDVYSLACVLYELLAGWPPLLAATEAETLARVRSVVPEPVSAYRDDLPEGLEELVAGALIKEPGARRGDTAELEVALSRLLGAVAPHYTETDLAATVVRLFERELAAESDRAEPTLSARIRAQLDEAGLATTGTETAAEMLAMGTVALGAAASSPPAAAAPAAFDAAAARPVSPRPAEDLGEPSAGGALLATAVGLSALIVGAIVAFVVYGRPATEPSDDRPEAALVRRADAAPAGREAGASPGPADAGSAAEARDASRAGRDAGSKHSPRRRYGFVTFNSAPWSFVYLDGSKLPGHTPIVKAKVKAGRHQARFDNPELGLSKTTSFHLAPGEETFVKVRLAPSPGEASGP